MFKLDLQIPASDSEISLGDKIYLAGSCFSDEIGKKLGANKFKYLSNPFGTIYNPISIFKTLEGSLDSDHTVRSQDVFYHWDCHGQISGLQKEELSIKVNTALESSQEFLNEADHLIITLGTSFVYRLNSTNHIVANCHKVPSQEFTKELLTKEEIVNSFAKIYEGLNNKLNIVLTVSPVRHIRDGLAENNLSKAVLINSVHEIVLQYPNVHYFPAYEIVIDELRDYRFFAEDLVHPSSQAIDYVWTKFSETYFKKETQTLLASWSDLRLAIQHQAFQPRSAAHQNFLRQTIKKVENLKSKIDVSDELKHLQDQLL